MRESLLARILRGNPSREKVREVIIACYYEPQLTERSLGTFNILATLALAAHECLPWVYLGYCVADCPALNYKVR